jgi:hypothetical protein
MVDKPTAIVNELMLLRIERILSFIIDLSGPSNALPSAWVLINC